MSRPKYVYTVCWKGDMGPLATFTVKYVAQEWAEAFCKRTGSEMSSLVRRRYGPNISWKGERVQPAKCPWEGLPNGGERAEG